MSVRCMGVGSRVKKGVNRVLEEIVKRERIGYRLGGPSSRK